MKVGAEPKKVAVLAGLLGVAAVTLYFNVFATGEPASTSTAPRPIAPPTAASPSPAVTPQITTPRSEAPSRRTAGKAALSEFKPRVGPGPDEAKPDPAKVDPAVRLDLLAKLQSVEMGAPGRNLFQYGSAPAPPVKPQPMPVNPPTIPINQPPQVVSPPAGPPPQPAPAPLTFKYYGYKTARSTGAKLAFLLDGEDIIVAGENEVVKKRYRVVRISPTAITMEDMQGRGQQTIQIEGQQPTA